jgi:hypothetical protein
MIATTIVHFSLLSGSWISAVSAVQDPEQQSRIDRFLDSIENESDWTVAYVSLGPDILDTYFVDRVENLKTSVDMYLDNMNVNFNYRVQFAPLPGPGLNVVLNELYRLVYLIKNSNLRILHDLRAMQYFGPRVSQPILAVINDRHVRQVSQQYIANKRARVRPPLDSLILDVGLIYSMNKTMLGVFLPRFQPPERLQRYHDMIKTLHHSMAVYMRIKTRLPNFSTVWSFEMAIDALAVHGIRGYERDQIQKQIEVLSNTILSVIVIYGSDSTPGTAILSGLLDDDPAIRRYMRVDPPPYVDFDIFCHQLLNSLETALEILEPEFLGRYLWFYNFRPMVIKLRELGNVQD